MIGRREIIDSGRPRAGFTLIEVMLATVIIGLGVLGLSALFAGAAKTQMDTSRLSRSTQLIERASDSARSRFGAVSKGRWNPTGWSYSTGQYPGGITVPGVATVWSAFSAYDENNNPGHPSHALAVDPSQDPTRFALEAFLLVETPEVIIYEDPLARFAGNVVRPTNYPPTGGLPSAASDEVFNTRATQPLTSANWLGAAPTQLRDLPFARLEPGSLRVRFEIATQGPEATSLRVISRRNVIFSDGARADDVDNVDIPDDDGVPQPSGPDGLLGSDGASWLMFDRGLDPQGPFQSSSARGPRSRIIAFGIRVQEREWIERIVVERGQRRVDRLLTLSERVFPNPDGTATGVSALWRRGRDGAHQLALAAYVAEPVTSGRSTPFIPPESGPTDSRLWRKVRLQLDYDRGAGRYTLSTSQNDRAFALATGQVLMIAGDGNNPNNAAGEPGAESFVRVVRTVLGTGSLVTGYLDGPPLDRGMPMIWPVALGTPSGYAMQLSSRRDVEVWALAPQVQSLSPDGRVWRIRPVEGRIVDVR